MSRLTDHLFGAMKPADSVKSEINMPTDMVEADETPNVNRQCENAVETTTVEKQQTYERRELAAEWHVPLRGNLHVIEFEHGTTSGKRIIWVDGKEVIRRDWMFKLVGDDSFPLSDLRCVLRVDPASGFNYKYTLFVNGMPLEEFKQRQAKALRIWQTTIKGKSYRIVLEKDTLNIFQNGVLREEEGEFTDIGTQTTWEEDGNVFTLSARNSGNKHEGLLHSLTINGDGIDEIVLNE